MPETITPLSFDDLAPQLKDLLGPAVERLGYFGSFFGYFGRTPDPLIKFMEFTAASKKHLSDDLNELIALVVCSRLGGDYERIQHERLCEKLGFDRAWVGVLVGRSSAEGVTFSAEQAACRALAEKMLETGGRDVSGEIDALAALIGKEACLAALWQIARFWMICVLVNSFAMKLPVSSIFDD